MARLPTARLGTQGQQRMVAREADAYQGPRRRDRSVVARSGLGGSGGLGTRGPSLGRRPRHGGDSGPPPAAARQGQGHDRSVYWCRLRWFGSCMSGRWRTGDGQPLRPSSVTSGLPPARNVTRTRPLTSATHFLTCWMAPFRTTPPRCGALLVSSGTAPTACLTGPVQSSSCLGVPASRAVPARGAARGATSTRFRADSSCPRRASTDLAGSSPPSRPPVSRAAAATPPLSHESGSTASARFVPGFLRSSAIGRRTWFGDHFPAARIELGQRAAEGVEAPAETAGRDKKAQP